jgi:hypothetical protein
MVRDETNLLDEHITFSSLTVSSMEINYVLISNAELSLFRASATIDSSSSTALHHLRVEDNLNS